MRVDMDVMLLGHTQLSAAFAEKLLHELFSDSAQEIWPHAPDGQIVSMAAIRTCYQSFSPQDVVVAEWDKYFMRDATDGVRGNEADRLIRMIVKSGHTSTLEHLTYTFGVSGVSRSLLAQITRHRHLSFSVQSQRYVKLGTEDRSGGFDYVMPPKVEDAEGSTGYFDDDAKAREIFDYAMREIQGWYDALRQCGIPAEDARFVLPNAAATHFVMTGNLRAWLQFYGLRRLGSGAQWEIAELATRVRDLIVGVEPWTDQLFEPNEGAHATG